MGCFKKITLEQIEKIMRKNSSLDYKLREVNRMYRESDEENNKALSLIEIHTKQVHGNITEVAQQIMNIQEGAAA